jgi:hypothetical protein
MEAPDRRRHLIAIAGRYDNAAAVIPCDLRGFAILVDCGNERPTRRENPVQLARDDESFEAPLERHNEHIGGSERFV